MSPTAGVTNYHHRRRKAQPASASARSSRKAEVTSVFVENRLEFWRGLASVVLRSGESPRRRAARSLDCRQFQLAVNLKTGKLGVTGSLSTSRESAMARANMPGRNHQDPSRPKPAARLKVLCPYATAPTPKLGAEPTAMRHD